jgi:hypothetical protein
MSNLKKIIYKTTHVLLTTGASVILGFLSFGGMLVISPSLLLAIGAFALSVGYEGEIYHQNIKGALRKLFGQNYTQLRLAKAYLLEQLTTHPIDAHFPTFFKDYLAQCELVRQFENKTLDVASLHRKEKAEKTLYDMEQWLARQLFSPDENDTANNPEYQKNLQNWLRNHQKANWLLTYQTQKKQSHLLKAFSSLTAFFMGLGTVYLLCEAVVSIPLLSTFALASSPWLILPLASIAGIAYGLLTYNTMTDLLTNNRAKAAYNRIFKANSPWTLHRRFMAVMAITLGLLAVFLTICTAGTWWTVAKEVPTLFEWMKKIPTFVMQIVHPIITGSSALAFNVQNTAESLEVIETLALPNKTSWQAIKQVFNQVHQQEHWLQWLNPFRLMLKITVMPLRIALFLGHLIGIGVTADRLPGIPEIVSAVIGIISEGFEDLHYFVGHGHDEHAHQGCCHHEHHAHENHLQRFVRGHLTPGHGHNHDLDLPTKALKFLFYPIYALSAVWDACASRASQKPLSLSNAWNKQIGESLPQKEQSVSPSANAPVSLDWKVEQTVDAIEHHKKVQLHGAMFGRQIAAAKFSGLDLLQRTIRQTPNNEALLTSVQNEAQASLYSNHRLFSSSGRTATENFLQQLSENMQTV